MAELGMEKLGVDQVGCGCLYLEPYLLSGDSVFHAVRVGDVGNDTRNWEGLEQIPPQCGLYSDGEATL